MPPTPLPSRGHLDTERANPRSSDLDTLSLGEALAVFEHEDATLPAIVAAAHESIVAALELIVERLRCGGRLFYVGAGTSGRLGVLDAVECPPTFQSPPEQVQGVLAGGSEAMFNSVEGTEDDEAAAPATLREQSLSAADVVFGITAGGTTPYVHGALRFAASVGAGTIFLACVPHRAVPDSADVSIRLETGPELLQGSTRLKAGTATKMVLNSISTLTMVALGKVHGNRMVDVDTRGNTKLRDRGLRLIEQLCGLDRSTASDFLDRAGGSVKLAILMHARNLDRTAARTLLERNGGFLRRALDDWVLGS